jgi:hypothetical protein
MVSTRFKLNAQSITNTTYKIRCMSLSSWDSESNVNFLKAEAGNKHDDAINRVHNTAGSIALFTFTVLLAAS